MRHPSLEKQVARIGCAWGVLFFSFLLHRWQFLWDSFG